jgi:hypothetical protein
LSGIFLQEGFPTSGNDIQVALLMTVLVTGQELQAGMKILMLARVTYHEVHGLSLNIRDIDHRFQ